MDRYRYIIMHIDVYIIIGTYTWYIQGELSTG
jgi:hypothetical protein